MSFRSISFSYIANFVKHDTHLSLNNLAAGFQTYGHFKQVAASTSFKSIRLGDCERTPCHCLLIYEQGLCKAWSYKKGAHGEKCCCHFLPFSAFPVFPEMVLGKFQHQAYSPQNYSLEQTTLTAVKSAMEVHLRSRVPLDPAIFNAKGQKRNREFATLGIYACF